MPASPRVGCFREQVLPAGLGNTNGAGIARSPFDKQIVSTTKPLHKAEALKTYVLWATPRDGRNHLQEMAGTDTQASAPRHRFSLAMRSP